MAFPAGSFPEDPVLAVAAAAAVRDSLQVAEGERVLIVTNPETEVASIAMALYNAALAAGGLPALVFQPRKSQLDFADESVMAALASRPQVFCSISQDKLGKDRQGLANPYSAEDKSYDNLFHYLLHGAKALRACWTPRITRRIFTETVPVDYKSLRERCAWVRGKLSGAVRACVCAPGGTDLSLGLRGRSPLADDGDFGRPGLGGNLPAGEVFISPELGASEGLIVFDGSIATDDGGLLIRQPIRARLRQGSVVEVAGGEEARQLRETLERAARRSRALEQEGKLAKGQGERYAENARGLGEMGIGLNPRAWIEGNILMDEKVYGTCHFAIGSNYDEDAPALIHLDGMVRDPTITIEYQDGSRATLMEKGVLSP